MRKVYEATIKYQTKLWSRITVDKLLKCHVGTNHVQSFAYNQVRRTKDKKVYFECVIENLKILRKSTVFEENEAKTNMIKAKIEMKKTVNMNTIAVNEYNNFIDRQWNQKWIFHKEKTIDKIRSLKEKQAKKLEEFKKMNIFKHFIE